MTKIISIQNLDVAQKLVTELFQEQKIDKSQNVLIDVGLEGSDCGSLKAAFKEAGNPEKMTLSVGADAFLFMLSTAMSLYSINNMRPADLEGRSVPVKVDAQNEKLSHRIVVAERQAMPA